LAHVYDVLMSAGRRFMMYTADVQSFKVYRRL